MRQLIVVLFLVLLPAFADADHPPAAGIASAHPLATEAGHRILAQGGNAFDAAIAVAAVLGVVEPQSAGLGGGGFWLLHRARDGFETVVDARERAPLAARADMYLDGGGNVIPRASLDGALAAGIPGQAAAFEHIAKRYGRLPLKTTLAPAIEIATAGFPVGERYHRLLGWRRDALSGDAGRIFLADGEVPDTGFVLRQTALAETLRAIAAHGAGGFYRGEVARKLLAGVRAAGGIWQARDLTSYRVIERSPLNFQYRGFRVTGAPPPAGGVVVLEMLNVLSPFALADKSELERDRLVIESMRLAYRDRARKLGDPDFVKVDAAQLLSRAYGANLRGEIGQMTPPEESAERATGTHTTHLSILDKEGNRAAVTLSINGPFGSGFVPAGTGVLLNNEMDDFVAKPDAPNLYGLVGSRANSIAPGKRMQSSMSPTFVEGKEGVAILGTPGGSRIISMVALAVLDFAQGRSLTEWIRRPRFHHQYLPDRIEYELGAFDTDTVARLTKLGYQLKSLEQTYGDMQAVVWDKRAGRVEAASDPRGEGAARVH